LSGFSLAYYNQICLSNYTGITCLFRYSLPII